MLCQIIKLHLEQSGTWISSHFGQIVHFLIKAPKLGRGRVVYFELIRCGTIVGSGGLAHVQIWSKAETFQKGRTYYISEPKWPLLWPPQL